MTQSTAQDIKEMNHADAIMAMTDEQFAAYLLLGRFGYTDEKAIKIVDCLIPEGSQA